MAWTGTTFPYILIYLSSGAENDWFVVIQIAEKNWSRARKV
jgi:hypothetical protein